MLQPLNNQNRKSIRLQTYDYSSEGAYFVTIVTQDRIPLFGKINNGKMLLNQIGLIAQEEWINTNIIRSNISLGEFIIMPDHIHMIIHIDYQKREKEMEWNNSNPKSPSHTIGAIIRGFKGATTKKINLFLNSTGELLFAPTELLFTPTELLFAPTELLFAPTELLFAPTEFPSPTELPIAPTEWQSSPQNLLKIKSGKEIITNIL